MDLLEDPYIRLMRKVISFFGCWPTQTYRERLLRYYIVGFTLLYSVLAQLCQPLTLDFNLKSIVVFLQMFVPFVCTVNLYCTTLLHLMTVQEIFCYIAEDWKQLKDEVELKIMQKHTNECKFLTIIYGCRNEIRIKIHQPFQNNEDNDNVIEKPSDLSDWIIDITQRLSRTRQFMTLVNKVSERSCLFQISLAFLLCIIDFLCAFQIPGLLERTENRKDVFTFIFFIVGSLFAIYINCYAGQRLMEYSMDVYQEGCLVPIYDISLKTQKLLLTTLLINIKPCAISVGKVFVFSHEFFSDLMRLSLSFAMVLHSAQNTRV